MVISPAGSHPSAKATRILLVEDSETSIAMIRTTLATGDRPILLTVAHDLAEARARLAKSLPDLAIVDLVLPDGKGTELLPADGEPAGFPIVVLTGSGNEQEAVEAMKAGALDYLVKSPQTLANMPHIVERSLREWRHITERKIAEARLLEANQELEAFVRNVSHDLRTPLTPIIGFADYLHGHYQDRLDEQGMRMLLEIKNQGERMFRMLEDLLALARVGHLERPGELVDTDDVLREVIAGLAGQIAASSLEMRTGGLPPLRLPRTLVAQVLDNLIGNAVRYAGNDGGTIEAGGERDGDLVRLYVRDHGPGIPETERLRIFDLFYRGSTGEKVAGTGVGLATVQKIARHYGGRAWVEETPGGGSTFWVEVVDD